MGIDGLGHDGGRGVSEGSGGSVVAGECSVKPWQEQGKAGSARVGGGEEYGEHERWRRNSLFLVLLQQRRFRGRATMKK